MKAKTKAKKSVGKIGRNKFDSKVPSIAEIPSCDLSTLEKPIDTSLTSLRDVIKLFETGTEEVKCLLAYECEVVYECRTCRSLFRSLLNFISHKRIYCPGKFNITMDKNNINPLEKIFEKLIDPESKENYKIEKPLRSIVTIPKHSKKDLSSIVTMLQNKQNDSEYDEVKENNNRMRIITNTEQLFLEVLESNRAAYQTVVNPEVFNVNTDDLMKAQTKELQNILSHDTAILGPDGYVLELDSGEKYNDPERIQNNIPSILNDVKSMTELVCPLCHLKFATKKTLTFHIKSLHTPNRLVYPCLCCDNYFPNAWGVYRHLMKVHRKTNAQVRKMRSEIQAKAYRKETTKAQEIEKARATRKSNSLNDTRSSTNETQEWMAHLESDGELQRCGGCGKRFDRKAALLSHSQICQRRLAACNDGAPKSKRSKSSPEIVEILNPSPIVVASVPIVENVKNETVLSKKVRSSSVTPVELLTPSSSSTKTSNNPETYLPIISSEFTITQLSEEPPTGIPIHVKDVETLNKDVNDEIGVEVPEVEPSNNVEADSEKINAGNTSCEVMPLKNSNNKCLNDPEIIFTKIEKSKNISGNNGSRKRKLGKRDEAIASIKRSNQSLLKIPDKPLSSHAETAQDNKQKLSIMTIENLHKLQCDPCKRKFTNITSLRRHMARHINWYRYDCKMCDFKCFDKTDCIAHCNEIHNAKNNRTSIAKMMEKIMPDNDTTESSGSILKKNISSSDLEVVCVNKPANEIHSIANDKMEIKCEQNGEIQPRENSIKSNGDDGSYCFNLDDEMPDKTNELAKNPRLDENPELRRMVMEVIFGSPESKVNEKTNSNSSSNEQSELDNNIKNSENQIISLPSLVTEVISNNIIIQDDKATKSKKYGNRHTRVARNRTKVEDKDFIYDLDAVLLKERVQENSRTIKVTNGNENNAIYKSRCKNNDDLRIIICKDNKVELGEGEKVV